MLVLEILNSFSPASCIYTLRLYIELHVHACRRIGHSIIIERVRPSLRGTLRAD